tara:strand:- start:3262 stop:4074 length:813 start_codon:yes stop_codon:yes gene_type:complete
MAVATDQLKEQISTLADEADEGNLLQQYVSGLKSIDRLPASADEISTRLAELNQLFPARRPPNIFDLASSLGRGLMMGAQSGRPTSLGYGLSAGFDLFNQQARKNREEANALRRELMLLARKEVQQEKATDIALQEKGLEASFKLELEKLKSTGGGLFKGKGDLASALNYILEAAKNPSMVRDEFGNIRPEYVIAKAIVEQPRSQVVQTDQGASVVTTQAINVDQIFKDAGLPSPTDFAVPTQTPVDTGRVTAEGKKIFKLPNGDVVVEQ